MAELQDFKLEQALGFHINRVSYLMTEEVEKRFAKAGLNIVAQDFAILIRLFSGGVISQTNIVDLMMRDKTTVTRRLDGLVKKGLIERLPNEKDRRRFDIGITDAGKAVLDIAFPIVSGFQRELVADVSDEEKETTIKTLRHLMLYLMEIKDK
ncbi:MarR family winged helix-turn-helix transcriptional regulator [Ghiorsea bivora]|uniref:MarR family winged helix-turn-helix transcriptional regulator n=1 Tax=Ghiorsea bivora TaxID=1485545 RepID=UPI000570B0AD|nr:MarR family transcriptional regulator [Ghiorsea bivora]